MTEIFWMAVGFDACAWLLVFVSIWSDHRA